MKDVAPSYLTPWSCVAAAAGLALVLGLASWDGEFVFDDVAIVRDNARLDSLASIPRFFIEDYWGDYVESGLYRPLTLTSFAVENALFGRQSATPFHIVNAILYALCSALVVVLALRLGAGRLTAGGMGLLFAAHPIHVEPVAGLVGRSEIGAGLFVILALVLESSGGRRRHGWGAAWGTAAAVLCALFCKETAIIVVPLLVLLPLLEPAAGATVLSPRGRLLGGLRRRWRSAVAVGAVTLLWLGLRAVAVGGSSPEPLLLNNALAHRDALGRLAGALDVSLLYAARTVVPWPLSPDYSYPSLMAAQSILAPGALGGALLWAGLGAGAWLLRKRAVLVAFGLVFFGLALLPVANLVFPIGTIFAERLLFLPSLGFLFALGGLGDPLLRSPSRLRTALMGLGVLALGAGSAGFVSASRSWHDELSVAEAIVAARPSSAKGQGKLGWELFRRARDATPPDLAGMEAGVTHLERAIELYPLEDDYVDSHHNLSLAYRQLGRLEEAEKMALEVDRRRPNRLNYLRVLLDIRIRRGLLVESLELCDRVLLGLPGNPEFLGHRQGVFQRLLRAGRFEDVAAYCRRVLSTRPRSIDHVLKLCEALGRAGQSAEAFDALDAVIQAAQTAAGTRGLEPRLGELLNTRGMLWQQRGDHARAVRDFSEAVTRSPGATVPLGNRARSYIVLGRLDDARRDIDALALLLGESQVAPLRQLLAEAPRQP